MDIGYTVPLKKRARSSLGLKEDLDKETDVRPSSQRASLPKRRMSQSLALFHPYVTSPGSSKFVTEFGITPWCLLSA